MQKDPAEGTSCIMKLHGTCLIRFLNDNFLCLKQSNPAILCHRLCVPGTLNSFLVTCVLSELFHYRKTARYFGWYLNANIDLEHMSLPLSQSYSSKQSFALHLVVPCCASIRHSQRLNANARTKNNLPVPPAIQPTFKQGDRNSHRGRQFQFPLQELKIALATVP